MPWIEPCDEWPNAGWPGHYKWPLLLSDDTVMGRNIQYAKERRRLIGQLREETLSYQKECGNRKDIDGARFFREVASDLMKQYRGWEGAIKIIEDDVNNYTHSHVSEAIAPYVDRALKFMDLQKADNNYL